jgi:hypothetical protein
MDNTAQLFRFRQFLAGIEDRDLLTRMRDCVDSQLSILPKFVKYVEPVVVVESPTYTPPKVEASETSYTPVGLHGWVPINECPIVAPNLLHQKAKKLPKGAKIKYSPWPGDTSIEAQVTNRGSVNCSVLSKLNSGEYSSITKKIKYYKISHVWYD